MENKTQLFGVFQTKDLCFHFQVRFILNSKAHDDESMMAYGSTCFKFYATTNSYDNGSRSFEDFGFKWS